jgi:hypothetical protein
MTMTRVDGARNHKLATFLTGPLGGESLTPECCELCRRNVEDVNPGREVFCG